MHNCFIEKKKTERLVNFTSLSVLKDPMEGTHLNELDRSSDGEAFGRIF
jgi:hypothetical protein